MTKRTDSYRDSLPQDLLDPMEASNYLNAASEDSKGVLAVEHKVKVTMPWSVAKLLMANLSELVQRHESANGELKLPGQYTVPIGL